MNQPGIFDPDIRACAMAARRPGAARRPPLTTFSRRELRQPDEAMQRRPAGTSPAHGKRNSPSRSSNHPRGSPSPNREFGVGVEGSRRGGRCYTAPRIPRFGLANLGGVAGRLGLLRFMCWRSARRSAMHCFIWLRSSRREKVVREGRRAAPGVAQPLLQGADVGSKISGWFNSAGISSVIALD